MKLLFARNLSNTGRLVRGLGAVGLLIAARFGFFFSIWLGVALAVFGLFDQQLISDTGDDHRKDQQGYHHT